MNEFHEVPELIRHPFAVPFPFPFPQELGIKLEYMCWHTIRMVKYRHDSY